MSELPEPLDQFLQTPPTQPLNAELRAQVLHQTAGLLPRKRNWGRWSRAAAVAAGIAAAFAAGYLLGSSRDATSVPLPNQEQVVRQPEPRPIPREEPKAPAVPAIPPTALELEWQAFDAPDEKERRRLYLQAGDVYLVQQQDCDSALRCYRQALSAGDTPTLELDPNDNWLVMALKRDHRKDK